MPIHAVLGATGGTGSAILRCLLSSQVPDLHIRILVRSKSKLLETFPQLESTASATVTIFEAPISNEAGLKACIEGASTIYVCVATNNATRKVDIAVTTAAWLIAALGQLRNAEGAEYSPPVVLFNRSLSLNSDVKLPFPGFAKRFFVWVLWTIYEDLLKAGALYAAAEKDNTLTCITADAPGLMDPDRKDATGYELVERGKASASINYADLGIAIVELGQRREEFQGKAVGISATGEVKMFPIVWISTVWVGLKTRLSMLW